jgi:hypothetical protein
MASEQEKPEQESAINNLTTTNEANNNNNDDNDDNSTSGDDGTGTDTSSTPMTTEESPKQAVDEAQKWAAAETKRIRILRVILIVGSISLGVLVTTLLYLWLKNDNIEDSNASVSIWIFGIVSDKMLLAHERFVLKLHFF